MNKTFLNPIHQEMNAKMVEFGGYQMPVWYSSIKSEHLAVRERVGVFDVSHMGVLLLSGSGTFSLLTQLSCNDPDSCRNGKMIYSMALNESGGILDDIMFGQIGDRVLLVVNAGNKTKILSWIHQLSVPNVHIEQLELTHCLLAVQGPDAPQILKNIIGVSVFEQRRFSVDVFTWKEAPVIVSRTGYTGEDGYEVIIPNHLAAEFWQNLMALGVTPCGLAARDSLRIEAALPLYGHELTETITPLETRYPWVIKLNHPFIGRSAIESQQQKGVAWTTVGLRMNSRVIPRMGYAIAEGGEITSGTLVPQSPWPIAMARLPVTLAVLGSTVSVIVRDQSHSATIVALPFQF